MLLFDTERFWYDTYSKTLENVEDIEKEEEISDNAVVFIHAEIEDENRKTKMLKKALKNIKWYLKKKLFCIHLHICLQAFHLPSLQKKSFLTLKKD